MVKRGNESRRFHRFAAMSLHVLGGISLILSLIFVIIGFWQVGWTILDANSASFWTVINSLWIFAILMFYFADKIKFWD